MFSRFSSSAFLHRKAEEAAAALPPLKAAAEKAATTILSGDHHQKKSGTGEKFWQYREYTAGDPLQSIDWRASAKTDRLYIRQKEWQTTQTALFWVQNDLAMSYSSEKKRATKQEEATILALALAILMTKAGEQIGHLDGKMRPGRTENAIEKMGELILATQDPSPLPHPAKTIKPNSNLILIGDFLSPLPVLKDSLSQLATRTDSALLIQVLDPAELDLPFAGRVIFENSSHEKHHIQNVESIKEQYKERITHHLDDVKTICKKHRWHWLLHRTDTPLTTTLFDAWMMLTHEHFRQTERIAR